MNPERWATLFRELLQTPDHEMGQYARRCSLMTKPNPEDLVKARELLTALGEALESAPGPSWHRVDAAWTNMLHARAPVSAAISAPAPPAWVRDAVAKPSLGDHAPGTDGHQEVQQERDRFVPAAKPEFIQPGQVAAPVPVAPAPAAPGPATPGPASPPPPPRRPPPPPRRGAPQATPADDSLEMSVARYASYCAACAAHPDRVELTQQEYGVANEAVRQRLDDSWQERFDEDAALQEQRPDLVDDRRSTPDKARAHAMQRLQIELLD